MTWLGALGAPRRLQVDEHGWVHAAGRGDIGWLVGAPDRWLDPRAEVSVRQRLIRSTPVVETLLHVGRDDVVWRTYAVAARGGALVVELENTGAVPVALAVVRPDSVPLATARPASTAPVPGVDFEPGTLVFAVPHRTTWRGAVPFGDPEAVRPSEVAALPSGTATAAGWVAHVDAGVRTDVPFAAELTAARCQLLLRDDPAAVVPLLQWGFEPAALERLLADDHTPLAGILEHWRLQRDVAFARATAAFVAAQLPSSQDLTGVSARSAAALLDAVGEVRAAGDVRRLAGRLGLPDRPTSIEPLDRMRDVLVDDWGDVLAIAPGWLRDWDGVNVEVHGLPTAFGRLSFAVRWHGDRPAVLWELEPHDEPFVITTPALSPSWRTAERRGEVLLSRS